MSKDTMEAETRLIFAWCAAKSRLNVMHPPPQMFWDDEDELLRAEIDGAVITFDVTVYNRVIRQGRGTIRAIFDEGIEATEEMDIPAEVSAAALALRDAR